MRCSRWGFIGCLLLCVTTARAAHADDAWRARAYLSVTAPGIIEAVVPPELISSPDRRGADIALIGPDGRLRGFELYWREDIGTIRQTLTPSSVQLDPSNGLVWEASLTEKTVARRLYITLNEKSAIGRIDVFGKLGDQWIGLVRNAAIFTTASGPQTAIDIPADTYTALRIHLTGYNRNTRQQLTPIRTVMLEGDRPGRDYAQQTIALPFQQSQSEGMHLVESVLPGNGLWIDTLHLATEAQFLGGWQVGREAIANGDQHFQPVATGRTAHVGKTPGHLDLHIHQAWPGRSLVIKLDAADRFIGAATALTVAVRLPRIVFSAEKSGRYTVQTGTGQRVAIQDFPGDRSGTPPVPASFSAVETNPQWRLATLVEKYRLKGAPFDPAGYTWRAPVTIPAPGYYRLPLNLQASLAPHPAAIRIVRENLQVPYLTGRPQDSALDLTLTTAFNAGKNISTWTIQLPQASSRWKTLTLQAAGLFKREVDFQRPKPATRSWQSWRRTVWENRDQSVCTLKQSLSGLPQGTQTIRVVIAHGDNQPITITHATATFTAPTVYFLAHAAGEYTLYGGNPDAGTPRYDLSLVQSELFSALPLKARMDGFETFQQPGWTNRIKTAFTESGWGLYAVLGLVTVVLIIVIVRLFPKAGEQHPS